MDIFTATEKPYRSLFQKITGLHTVRKMSPEVYLLPSSIHFPHLDMQGNQTVIDEAKWDKHIFNIKDYPKLQVVQKDGEWFALNCSQLHLFQKWETEGKCSKVKVDVVSIHHVPPVLRNLMTVGTDSKHLQSNFTDKSYAADHENSSHSIPWTNNVTSAGCKLSHITSQSSTTTHVENCESSHLNKKTNPLTVSSEYSRSNLVTECGCPSHLGTCYDIPPCHVGLKLSRSDPNGTILKDCEENEVEFKDIVNGDLLYKTSSSFQLEKQSEDLEGVEMVRGYHKVHQIESSEDSSESSDECTDEGEGDEEDGDISDNEESDNISDNIDGEASDISGGTEDSGSVYSNDVGSDMGWTDDDDYDNEESDQCTHSESESEISALKQDENESLL